MNRNTTRHIICFKRNERTCLDIEGAPYVFSLGNGEQHPSVAGQAVRESTIYSTISTRGRFWISTLFPDSTRTKSGRKAACSARKQRSTDTNRLQPPRVHNAIVLFFASRSRSASYFQTKRRANLWNVRKVFQFSYKRPIGSSVVRLLSIV